MDDKNHKQIISKEQALALGLKKYYTGVPCVNGHLSERNIYGQCKSCANISSLKHHYKHREKRLKTYKSYSENNKEKVSQRRKKYNLKNKEKRNFISKEWHSKNKEKAKKYRIDRKALYAVHARNRRTKLMESGGSHTHEDVLKIGVMQKWKCAGCSKKCQKKYHVDHIKPISLGGCNNPSNLQILCPKCNLSKNDKDPLEWANSIGKML